MTTKMWLTCWWHHVDYAAMTATVMTGDRQSVAVVAVGAAFVADAVHRTTCAAARRAACASSYVASCYPV